MEHVRHSQHVLMQIKIKQLVNQIHHVYGLQLLQQLHVPHILVQHLPQDQIVNQFQAMMDNHIQFVTFQMELVKLLTQEP